MPIRGPGDKSKVRRRSYYLDKAAREYLETGSLARALIASGAAATSGDVSSLIQSRRDEILRRAAEIRRAEAEQWAVTRAEAIRALSDIITADPAPALMGEPPEQWPPSLRRAVQSYRSAADGGVQSLTLADRVGALRTLLTAQGWLTERVEITALVGLADRLQAARARVLDADERPQDEEPAPAIPHDPAAASD